MVFPFFNDIIVDAAASVHVVSAFVVVMTWSTVELFFFLSFSIARFRVIERIPC